MLDRARYEYLTTLYLEGGLTPEQLEELDYLENDICAAQDRNDNQREDARL